MKEGKCSFPVPSVEEVTAYAAEKGYVMGVERFFSFYEMNGWMVGKNRMRSWRAAVTNWHNMEQKTARHPSGAPFGCRLRCGV